MEPCGTICVMRRTFPWAKYTAAAPLLPPQYSELVNTVMTFADLHTRSPSCFTCKGQRVRCE